MRSSGTTNADSRTLSAALKVTIPESLYGILGTANDFTKEILDLKAEEAAAKKGKSKN